MELKVQNCWLTFSECAGQKYCMTSKVALTTAYQSVVTVEVSLVLNIYRCVCPCGCLSSDVCLPCVPAYPEQLFVSRCISLFHHVLKRSCPSYLVYQIVISSSVVPLRAGTQTKAIMIASWPYLLIDIEQHLLGWVHFKSAAE